MKLLEYQGKQLLKEVGIETPAGVLVNNKTYDNLSYGKQAYHRFFDEHGGAMVKAQVIGGKRKKSGLVFEAVDYEKSLGQIDKLYQKKYGNFNIDTLLIEEKLAAAKEYFLSITYDTLERRPMILFSSHGGIDIEKNQDKIARYHPARVSFLSLPEAKKIIGDKKLADFLVKAYGAFIKFDCSHLEVNPIILSKDGRLCAADAKLTIDDAALARQETVTGVIAADNAKNQFTPLEVEARKIDQHDHRGVAGKTFVELSGDIAILASGGGASLVCMDALIQAGGNPANYTEYSGNPPRGKVRKLTALTLSKPGLRGCLVIGGTANFTDIFETLSGFAEGLQDLPEFPQYPIAVRRAGPRDKEAFVMLQKFADKNKLNMTLFGQETPMSLAAKIMVEKVLIYKKQLHASHHR